MEQQITTKQKSTTKITALVLVGVFAVSFAGLLAAGLLTKNNATENVSIITPRQTGAATPADNSETATRFTPRGAYVHIEPNQLAAFTRAGGGRYTVQYLGGVSVEPTTTCLQAFPNRAHVIYTEYDAQNSQVDRQDLTIGPCDIGWAVDVAKAESIGPRAVLTVPAIPATL